MTVTAPMCKVCGNAHWFREPHVFVRHVATPRMLDRPAAPLSNNPAVLDKGFDKKAYQRAYMAKRRAKGL